MVNVALLEAPNAHTREVMLRLLSDHVRWWNAPQGHNVGAENSAESLQSLKKECEILEQLFWTHSGSNRRHASIDNIGHMIPFSQVDVFRVDIVLSYFSQVIH